MGDEFRVSNLPHVLLPEGDEAFDFLCAGLTGHHPCHPSSRFLISLSSGWVPSTPQPRGTHLLPPSSGGLRSRTNRALPSFSPPMTLPSVLIGCECSGIIREAFRRHGCDAWSCDLKPAEDNSPYHIQGDVLLLLEKPWDLVIAHPPCTYLCSMGIWWNHKRPERWIDTKHAKDFFLKFVRRPLPRLVIENPVGYMNTHFRKPDQIIHPWQFGHEASKPTCLWLRGLPKIVPTCIVGKGKFYTKSNGSRMAAWSHRTSGTRKEERASIASRTFPGIAEAMASQWSPLLSLP